MVLPVLSLAYVMWHVWGILPFPNVWKAVIVAAGTLAFLTTYLNFSKAIEGMPLNVATFFYETGNSSLIILLYLFMVFLVLDLGRLVRLVPSAWLHSNGYAAASIFVLMVCVFVYGNVNYHNKVRRELNLTTQKKQGKDMKIVMLSDLHLGYHNRREEFARWVDMINAEHPDLILIAGDVIDISVRPLLLENMAEEFRRLKAPVYACLGNHEYYSGEPLAQKFYTDAGIRLLRDSVATVGGLCIVGRDDRTNVRRKSLEAIMQNVDRDRYIILLDHQPHNLEQAEQCRVDFQFSGHTHHGQIWPASWVTEAVYEDAFGPYKKGDTQYYVSSGMGIWGGKFRIGTCSEYVVAHVRGV